MASMLIRLHGAHRLGIGRAGERVHLNVNAIHDLSRWHFDWMALRMLRAEFEGDPVSWSGAEIVSTRRRSI